MFSNYFKRDKSKPEKQIARVLLNNSMTLAIAESCTGGLLSSRMTDIPGSSVYTKANFVTYSNEAKHELLSVSTKKLEEYGAVSREVAHEMAEGLYDKTKCDIAICTTGIAGPSGGSDDKPVGLLYVAIKNQLNIDIKEYKLDSKEQL